MSVSLNILFALFLLLLWPQNFGVLQVDYKVEQLSDNYVLEKEAEGIKIYHKVNPNKGYVEYKAITTIKSAHLNHFLEFFTNDLKHTKWIYKCIESKITKKDDHTYLYQVLNSTWPLKDRDLSVEVVTKKIGNQKVTVDFISKTGIHPENPRYVRLSKFISNWEIEEASGNLKLTVETSFDPRLKGGGFLLKSYTTKIPFETLRNLKEVYRPKK